MHCKSTGVKLWESTCRAGARIGVCFIFACLCLLRQRKDKETSCVCSICGDRRTESTQDLKRCPLCNAVGLETAAGSKKAMFWFSLWRKKGKIIIIQDVPPILLLTAVLIIEGYYCYHLFENHQF